MAKVLSSISGNLISAASAGYAPTNSADVSAIASAYQVVSATGTQLYVGTAHVTSINGAPISASRAGNAANASLANSAWYDGTGRLISSLPDSATVSAIASGYATGKVDKSAISAQSANWNSVYTTVNLNSASWSGSTGGGGNVTSPSGTIFVKDGTAIEGTNSAVVVDQTSVGKTSILPIQGYAIGPTGMGVLTYGNLDESGMNLVFMIAGEYRGDDATVIISGRDYNWNFASASGLIVEGDTSANIPLGTVQSQLSASSYYWINLLNSDLSGVKAPGYAVTSVGELAWKSAVDNVTNTVAVNSAHWGQGGVDSATVSAIASGYASSKADSSALSSYALSADVSSTIDTVSSNSASWGGGATGDYLEKSSYCVAQGVTVTASGNALALGTHCSADSDALALGNNCSSYFDSVAVGYNNTANFQCVSMPVSNSSYLTSVAIGFANKAATGSVALGLNNSAFGWGVALGKGLTAENSAVVVGSYNQKKDGATSGDSAAFVIGDGTASTAKHDLLVVTKDGEITTYSSTADTSGTGVIRSIRALSADVSSTIDTVSSNSATWGATPSAFPAEINTGSTTKAIVTTGFQDGAGSRPTLFISSNPNSVGYPRMLVSENHGATGKSSTYLGDAFEFYTGASANGTKVLRIDTGKISGTGFYLDSNIVQGDGWSYGVAKNDQLTSVYDTVSSNSATWGAGGIDSATCSAIASSYANDVSAAVSGTVDTVSTQSANWGGSALALSAGPGVSLTKSGNTLIAGLDETVLWSGTTTNITALTLSETYQHFDRVRFYWKPWSDTLAWRVTEIPSFALVFTLDAGWAANGGTGKALFVYSISSNGTAFSQIQGGFQNITGSTTWTSSTNCTLAKVVGVNRTAGV